MSLPLAAAAAFFRPPAAAPAAPVSAQTWLRDAAADVTLSSTVSFSFAGQGFCRNATHMFWPNFASPTVLLAHTLAGVRDASADRTIGGTTAVVNAIGMPPNDVKFLGSKIYVNSASGGGGVFVADDPGPGGTAVFTLISGAIAPNAHVFALTDTHLYSMVWVSRSGYQSNGYGQITRLTDNANVGTFRYGPARSSSDPRPSWMDDGPRAAFAYGDAFWIIPHGPTQGRRARAFRLTADGLTVTRDGPLEFTVASPSTTPTVARWGDRLMIKPDNSGAVIHAYRQFAPGDGYSTWTRDSSKDITMSGAGFCTVFDDTYLYAVPQSASALNASSRTTRAAVSSANVNFTGGGHKDFRGAMQDDDYWYLLASSNANGGNTDITRIPRAGTGTRTAARWQQYRAGRNTNGIFRYGDHFWIIDHSSSQPTCKAFRFPAGTRDTSMDFNGPTNGWDAGVSGYLVWISNNGTGACYDLRGINQARGSFAVAGLGIGCTIIGDRMYNRSGQCWVGTDLQDPPGTVCYANWAAPSSLPTETHADINDPILLSDADNWYWISRHQQNQAAGVQVQQIARTSAGASSSWTFGNSQGNVGSHYVTAGGGWTDGDYLYIASYSGVIVRVHKTTHAAEVWHTTTPRPANAIAAARWKDRFWFQDAGRNLIAYTYPGRERRPAEDVSIAGNNSQGVGAHGDFLVTADGRAYRMAAPYGRRYGAQTTVPIGALGIQRLSVSGDTASGVVAGPDPRAAFVRIGSGPIP